MCGRVWPEFLAGVSECLVSALVVVPMAIWPCGIPVVFTKCTHGAGPCDYYTM